MAFILKKLNTPFVDSTDELFETAKAPPGQRAVTRMDFVSFMLFSAGNNGHAVFNYLPTMLQYLAYRGGFDPNNPTVPGCDMDDLSKECRVSLSGVNNSKSSISVSSMVLYVQAFSFLVQFFIFITIGSLGDFGRINLWTVLASGVTLCASQFACLAVMNDDGSQWYIMAILVFLALVGFNTCYMFFIASFPLLSDNLPIVQRAYNNEHMSKDEKQIVVDSWRNSTSLWLTGTGFAGQFVLSCILYGIAYMPWSTGPFISSGHTLGDSAIFIFIATAACSGFMVVCSIPYIITKLKSVNGPPFPEDAHYLTYGWISVGKALKEIRHYRQLFVFTISYFMINDAVTTVTQLMSIIIGQITHFSATQQTLIGMLMALSTIVGCALFYYIFDRFNISPKTSLMILVALESTITIYGCIGINTTTLGFRTEQEVWIYGIWGIFVGPTLAVQNTVASLLIPKGKENMFFGIFGVASRASSWCGPLVIGAIAQQTGNLWLGWPFLLAVYVVALVILYTVDMDAGASDMISLQSDINKES